LSAFFVIIDLPSLANFEFLPPGNPTLLSQYVILNSQYDLNFNSYSGHAYSVSATSDQTSTLQPFLPSINKNFDAVMILTKQQGETYLIIYATELEKWANPREYFKIY
jgi:hypothetical protein